MAASANVPMKGPLEGNTQGFPADAGAHIYSGTMQSKRSDGYVGPLAAGEPFVGHAVEEVDNTSGGNGALTVKVYRGRYVLQVTITGVAITDVGKDVYGSDDATYTLTQSTNTFVGKVARYVAANTAEVEFYAGEGNLDVVNHQHTAGTDGGPLTSPRVITAIADTNGNELIKVTATSSAVNEITVANAATGNAPAITATGGDTNVGLTLDTKGAGKLALGSADSVLAVFGGTGAVQQNHIADSASAGDQTTKINAILAALEAYGLLKES